MAHYYDPQKINLEKNQNEILAKYAMFGCGIAVIAFFCGLLGVGEKPHQHKKLIYQAQVCISMSKDATIGGACGIGSDTEKDFAEVYAANAACLNIFHHMTDEALFYCVWHGKRTTSWFTPSESPQPIDLE